MTAPPPIPKIRAPHIEWPTALVLCVMLAALVGVWALASPEQRADMLTGIAAVGGVALALMRAMLREQRPEPPEANGLDREPPWNQDAFGRPRPWRGPPAPPPPPSASAVDDDDDDTRTHRIRRLAPGALRAFSLCFPVIERPIAPISSPTLFMLFGPDVPMRAHFRASFWDGYRQGCRLFALPALAASIAVLVIAGCSPSALRTHSTIATVARVGVVAAHPAIVRACEGALATCTDDACLERVGADCRTAAAARDTAHEAVAAYVDAIEIAAHADEGAVGPALSSALDLVVHAYEAARVAIRAATGYDLPALPAGAIAIVRALIGGAS
jgi:hypothetical protein